MLGPVYPLEWLCATRRLQRYPWRWIYVGVLFIEAQWLTIGLFDLLFETSQLRDLVSIADRLLRFVALQQAAAILFLAPACAAGSITDEKQRRTFDFLLTTPLSDTEIVVGKWMGQATQVLYYISPGYFFLALLGGTLGERAGGLFLSMAEQIVLLYALVAVSLLVSSVSRSTPRAIMGVFLLLGALLTGEWLGTPLVVSPALLSYPLRMDVPLTTRFTGIAVLSAATLTALTLTIWRLRPAHEHQQSAVTRVLGRWWDRPPIGDAPMRWKERFIGDWFSIPLWRQLPRWQKCTLLMLAIGAIAVLFPTLETFIALGVLQLVFSTLFVAVRAAGAITGERENNTWESLLTTHMDAYQIVRGKLWGQIDAVRPFLIAYLIPASLGALLTDDFALFWVGYLWVASWMTLYYLGAVGIASSAKTTSTWRSIIATLTYGNYSLISIGLIFSALLGGLIACSLSCLPWAPGAVAIFLALGSIPGLIWLFAQTEEILQEAEKEVREKRD